MQPVSITAEQEYDEKVKLGERIQNYYADKVQELNLSSFSRIQAYLDETPYGRHRLLSRGIVFAHKDFEPFASYIARGEPFTVVSGLNPSSPLHLGHKVLFDLLRYLQALGADIYIPLTNDESYLDGKTGTLAESRRIAYEKIIPSILAFGFDPAKTRIFVMSDYPEIYNLAIQLSKYVTNGTVAQVFGEKALDNAGKAFYRSAVQLAQILLPQLPEFGGPRPTLVPVGIDQHPYVLLARDLAKKAGFVPPSELIFKFQNSLLDPTEKMSGSKPNTAIYLNESVDSIRTKIRRAYTGSVSSLAGHQQYGAVPEACSVFSLLNFHHPDDEYIKELEEQYRLGKISTRELKEITADFLISSMAKYPHAQADNHRLDEYVLKKPLGSLLSV